jgi:hypothetical protein
VLASIYEPSEVERILERITVSSGRVDHAIALGAALIANGTVSVQERFLADVGIKQSAANAELRSALGLPVDSEDGAFYLMPIISRGTPLPTSISSEMLKLNCTMKHGETVDVDVLFDNGRGASWVQTWELPHPDIEVGNSDKVDPCSCVWSIEIDADGVLTVSIRSKSGVSKKTGSVSPPRASAGKVMIEVGPTQKVKSDDYPRITCEQLKNTIRDLGSDDCPRITCEQLKTTVQDLGKARKSGGKG